MSELQSIYKISQKANHFEDLYDILWKYYDSHKVEKKHYHNLSIGLFNIPCGGFGDIIVTKSFHDYLKQWYPSSNVTICTTGPQKYKDLGLSNTNIVELEAITIWDEEEGSECQSFDNLKFKKKTKKFDLMVVIPIINEVFNIKTFKKLVPYANVFNTFSVSEYNGEYPPYTFPIGVGEGQLGLLMNDFKYKQQTLIKKPYALVYIQPSPNWGVHSKSCFLSYIEMICKNYHKKHSKFQVVIPQWIDEEVFENDNFRRNIIKVIKKYYDSIYFIDKEGGRSAGPIYDKENSKSRITFRADILPQKREIFISLMKDSIRDILVTGDQSLTDIISCCKKKRVWYQIAPWKKGLAQNLQKHLPNKYYNSFKTSCGTVKSVDLDIDWRSFMKDYDFRIHGRKRMDSILISHYNSKDKKFYKDLLNIIEHSRYLETAQQKIKKLLNN
tara:strand:+ start:1175 stop:2500 length:1326 start_codon:yes stop_codon:yes gene_type:complete